MKILDDNDKDSQIKITYIFSHPLFYVCVAVVWWAALLYQIWNAWDLSGVWLALSFCLIPGPETFFCLVGIICMVIGLVFCFKHRAWISTVIVTMTLVGAIWVAFTNPIYSWGMRLYLWRNESVFLADAQVVLISVSNPNPKQGIETANSGMVYVEGNPARIAFARRQIGFFHWAAFVYDPSESILSEVNSGSHVCVFGPWSLITCDRLWGDWFYVAAMK